MSSERRKAYPFDRIDPKWQAIWDKMQIFHASNPGEKNFDPAKPKSYILDMFPYPSGAGLHVGHPEGYTATDIIARYKRLRGFNVLHPMGWDAFGLPAEQYAIRSGQHPAVTTRENVAKFKSQLKRIGFSYDWQREINTTDPSYYKWTQWIFLQIYNSWFNPKTNKAEPISKLIEEMKSWKGYKEWSPDTRRKLVDDRRLAYVEDVRVWWCQELGTVLANEEVVDGKSEIGEFPVVKRPMRQWMLRITAYSERLIRELEDLDWPESIKRLQRNWIGRSEGAIIDFEVEGADPRGGVLTHHLSAFTTRPDTLYGATFIVIAPENDVLDHILPSDWPEETPLSWRFASPDPRSAVSDFRDFVGSLSDLQRTLGKSGVFLGLHATNPVSKEPIPVFFSEYVLPHYGTGAIMGVPAHDERDLEFARAFDLPIKHVVAEPRTVSVKMRPSPAGITRDVRNAVGEIVGTWTEGEAFCEDGIAFDSPIIDGLPTAEAKEKMTAWLEERGLGKGAINYKLRDWLFSRQRYWGEPFPIVWESELATGRVRPIGGPDGQNRHHRALDESELPVVPPPLEDYKPTGTGEPPLSKAKEWVRYSEKATRETNVMPQWAGSCWYYLRFCDPHNDKRFVGEEAERYWMGGDNDEARMANDEGMTKHQSGSSSFIIRHSSFKSTPGGVDLYVGGTEHAVLHLLYARFWHKVLFDLGYLSKPEPFQRLVNQGIILGEDNQKMSKSRGNIVNPDDVIELYGADAFRCYEMFMGPLEQMKPWSMRGVEGVSRFLARVWRLMMSENQAGDWELSAKVRDVAPTDAQQKIAHATIKKVTEDIESLSFNTALSQMMIFVNAFIPQRGTDTVPLSTVRTFLVLLNPFAPHLTSELWEKLRSKGDITDQPWPAYDAKFLVENEIELPVQVNGKFQGVLKISASVTKDEIVSAAEKLPKVRERLPHGYSKVLVVPGKVVNFVTN